MVRENKNSKLVVQSYLNGKLSNKIQLSKVNLKVEKYKQEKFEKLNKFVDEINKLKGNEFSFGIGTSFLISDEVVKIDDPHIPPHIGTMYSYEPTYLDKLHNKEKILKMI